MKFVKSSLLALAAVACGVPALAADLPYRKGPPIYTPPPLPIFTWTGFYAGVNAGAVFNESSSASTFVSGVPAGTYPSGYRTRDTGFIGGGQIGYNYQMGAFVAGLETDIQGSTLDRSQSLTLGGVTGAFRNQLDYLGTVRGRLGYAPMERLLLYATGGFAYGGTELTYAQPGIGGGIYSGSNSSMRTGYALGGGLEYAFTPNWSVKAEYLYYDLGRAHVTAFNPVIPASTATASLRESGSIARVGLNYKFW